MKKVSNDRLWLFSQHNNQLVTFLCRSDVESSRPNASATILFKRPLIYRIVGLASLNDMVYKEKN